MTEKATEKATEKVTEKEQIVLNLLKENSQYTLRQLSDEIGVSRKTVAAKIKSLKEKGKIERVGSDRKGYWLIKK